MTKPLRRWRVFVRNTCPEFFDSWEVEAESIASIFAHELIRQRLGPRQPYDELIVTEIR